MKRDPSATEGSEDLGDQYKDERTEKKIRDHLNDQNDVITEQDIANAPAGPVGKNALPADIPDSKKEALKEEQKDQEENKIKDNEDPGIETAWNVLGS